MPMQKTVKIRPRRFIKVLFLVLIILFILFLYARYINTKGLVVKEIAIIDEELDGSYNGFKIVHFSDIHMGRTTDSEDLELLTERINELKADIIVFTGDLFDKEDLDENDIDTMTKCLKDMEARLFKVAVAGDYDQYYEDQYQTILNDSDFILLDNTNMLIYDNSSVPINLVGLTDDFDSELFEENNYFTITLVHKPDTVNDITNINIVLAGHSLGGQIKIPFVGGIIKKDGANTYINDYYNVDEKQLYISNGIGTERFSFRLFNKPSISLYRLYNY